MKKRKITGIFVAAMLLLTVVLAAAGCGAGGVSVRAPRGEAVEDWQALLDAFTKTRTFMQEERAKETGLNVIFTETESGSYRDGTEVETYSESSRTVIAGNTAQRGNTFWQASAESTAWGYRYEREIYNGKWYKYTTSGLPSIPNPSSSAISSIPLSVALHGEEGLTLARARAFGLFDFRNGRYQLNVGRAHNAQLAAFDSVPTEGMTPELLEARAEQRQMMVDMHRFGSSSLEIAVQNGMVTYIRTSSNINRDGVRSENSRAQSWEFGNASITIPAAALAAEASSWW
jgi:hypothetical protein